MPLARPNFCPTCGGALSADGKSLKSLATNCATCRRRAISLDIIERSRKGRLNVLVFAGVAVLLAVCLIAWMISVPSAPVYQQGRTGWTYFTPTPVIPPQVTPTVPSIPQPVNPPVPPDPTLAERYIPPPSQRPPVVTWPTPSQPRVVTPPRITRPRTIVHKPSLQRPPAPDPRRDSWDGSFLLQSRANVASIFVNGQSIFSINQAGVHSSPQITLHRNDRIVFEITAPSGVMRAAFVTHDGTLQIPFRAGDLHDLHDRTDVTTAEFATFPDHPGAVTKVPAAEVNEWESAGTPTPHGSEYVNGKDANTYHLGFVVTNQAFHVIRTAQEQTDRRLFLFDDASRMAQDWKWKANFTMNADGATGPQEPDNELVSRFLLDGDFTVDLDADFGQAIYTNTGGMFIAACKQEIGFDGGWNFGSWGGTNVHLRVQRLGDELQLLRDGQVLIVPVPDSEAIRPTPLRLWWRSRASHFHAIKVSGESIIDG